MFELVSELVHRDPTALDEDALLDTVGDWDRVIAWAQAQQCAAIAEFTRRRTGGDITEYVVDELAAALRLSRAAAGNRMHIANQLDQHLPETAAALGRGDIDLPKARAVVEATSPLDPETTAAVEARVLPKAPQQTVGQLRASLSRAVLAADPASAQERHERAVAHRHVTVRPLPDGMAELHALLSADAATAIYAAIDAYARTTAGLELSRSMGPIPAEVRGTTDGSAGEPGMDARRADALLALVTGAATVPMRPLVHITVPAGTLLDLDDAPGEMAGYGPVPAAMARRVAADPTGTWRRILTDPATGDVVDISTKTYRPPAALARQVAVRDGRCRFPGCRQPAHRCDLDHVRPWPAGPTSAENLITLCRRHHRLKHSGHWHVVHAPDGGLTWTAPTGHTYTTYPQPNLPADAGSPQASSPQASSPQASSPQAGPTRADQPRANQPPAARAAS